MKSSFVKSVLVAGVLVVGVSPRVEAQEDRRMGIRRAVEVEFETEHGHFYRLQQSTNLVDWVDVEDAVYGHGGREDRLFSTRREDRSENVYYRVVVTDAPINGLAPWKVAGLTIGLDNSVAGDKLQFLSETNGVKVSSTSDAFVYTLVRTGTNELRVETRPSEHLSERVHTYFFTFVTPSQGTWVREEYRRGKLKDLDTGAFVIADGLVANPPGGTTPSPVSPVEVPSTLGGLAFTFQSGGTPDKLEFATGTTGVEFGDDAEDNEANTFTYVYSLSAPSAASLAVTFKQGKWDEYDLTFTSASQGTFVRREYKDGVLDDTDRGAFSAVVLSGSTNTPPNSGGSDDNGGGSGGTNDNSGGTNNPPGNVGMPADSVNGLTYIMNDGGAIPATLIFRSASTGTELDDSDPTQFAYTYKTTGANTASLVLQFKPDRWDEYDLTFAAGSNSGTFVRREFDQNQLKRTRTGSFTGAANAP